MSASIHTIENTYLQLADFRIRYGNEWIEIKIKFKGTQTFLLTYPRALEINVAQYYGGFFGHIYRAEYWWDVQRMAKPVDTYTLVMHKRAQRCVRMVNKLIKQLEESGE